MLENYIKELEEDLKIDELNLKDYQLRLPAMKHKWAGRLIRLKLELVQDNKKLDKFKKTLAEEVEKAAPVKLSAPAINSMIESHDAYKEFRSKIEEKKLAIELLEKSEKIFNSATYDIKNLVEIMKLEIT
jgi:hypothetical protein